MVSGNIQTVLKLFIWPYITVAILFVLVLLVPVFFSKEPQTYSYAPVSANKAQELFILFHGGNSTYLNIMEVAEYYANHFPNAAFVAPEGIKPSFDPYQRKWYHAYFLKPNKTKNNVDKTLPVVQNHIEKIMEQYEIPAEKTYLLGFSQGAVVALHAALRMEKSFAGIILLSGYIAGEEVPLNEHLLDTPILLTHGSLDNIIDPRELDRTYQLLDDKGYNVNKVLVEGVKHLKEKPLLDAALQFIKNTQ